jgi:hypothetical protein
MPYVEQWRHTDDALKHAAAVSSHPDGMPKWLQPWAAALKQLGTAVLPLLKDPSAHPSPASPASLRPTLPAHHPRPERQDSSAPASSSCRDPATG